MTGDRKVGPLFISTLAAITLIAPLSLHMFFPAIPDIKASFGVSHARAELTLSIPLFAMAFATLVYGSMSDRHGRRPVLLTGIVLFISGAVAAALAESIWVLIGGRVLQALGGACGLGLARTIARDVFGTDRLVKVIAYLTMAYTLGPMIATPVGSALIDISGWRSLLACAAAIGVVLLALIYFVLFETHSNRVGNTSRGLALGDYVTLFRNPRIAGFVLQSGFSSGAFFAMASAAAFLMTEYLHRPATEYGLYFFFFPGGFLLGNFVSSRIGGRVAGETMVLCGASILIVTALSQFSLIALGIFAPLVLFVPGFLATFAQGLALPNGQAGAIVAAKHLAGTAAGLGVFLQMFCAGIFTQYYGLIADGTPLPMAIAVLTSASLSFAFGLLPWAAARRERKAAR